MMVVATVGAIIGVAIFGLKECLRALSPFREGYFYS